ncbi:adhesion G protein-coupled receptor B2 [Trichonephila clavipes]|nr:adhesion G protein-coupled receptor B2 [Trichonephila clavipes]
MNYDREQLGDKRQAKRSQRSTGTNGTQNTPRPEGPDGCWAWAVAIACFVILFVVGGLGRLFALVFVELIKTFGVNRKSAALPFSIHLAIKNISGPLVGHLSQNIGLRAIVVLGAFISAFSIGACYFAESITIIVILWGLINDNLMALHFKYDFWHMTATAGSDVVQSGRPIFDDFFQHLWPYIGNNTANVVFQMVKRLWLIRIDQ